VSKLQDQLKAKLFEKKGKENQQPSETGLVADAKIIPSNEVKFSKMSGESDLNLMIIKSREEIFQRISQENQ
jgi:hypothetical protein